MGTYFLRLMGPPGLFVTAGGGERHEIDLAPASLSLLALLGCPGRRGGLARDRLAEILSPGCDPAKSASRLSSAVCRLRSALGGHAPQVLKAASGNQALALQPTVVVDVQRLADASEALLTDPSEAALAALETAVEARAGESLDGVKDPWAEDARADITVIYEHALEQLIAAYRDTGDVHHSITTARSLLREDPYREDIHAVLLELYGRKGMRGRAASHFNGIRAVLRDDLGVAPGRALQSSLQTALSDTRPNLPEVEALYAKLVEIDRTMRRLAHQMDRLLEAQSEAGLRAG